MLGDLRKIGAEKKKARLYWEGLDSRARGELGDAFVLGTFDWREWLTAKPSSFFIDELESCRLAWECGADDEP